MAKTILVERDIDAGLALVTALEDQGFPVAAAFWSPKPESSEYELVIASSIMDENGPIQAYTALQQAMLHTKKAAQIRLSDVKLVSPSAESVRHLARVLRFAGVDYVRYSPSENDNAFIDDVIVYRLPQPIA